MQYPAEWFNDDLFWKSYAPIIFDKASWEEVPSMADSITALARLPLYEEPAPACVTLLDQCCGFGRFSLEMARRGFIVTGVDINATYLETAREDAAYEKLPASFVQDDVRSFVLPDTFDIVTNVYTSFGYFADPAHDRLTVKNAFESLKAQGTYIIETRGKEIAVRDFVEREWFTRAGFTVLTEYQPVNDWEQLLNRWILIKGQERLEKVFTQRLYAASELRRLMGEIGFCTCAVYGDWDESAYDNRARTMIVVGRKG
ncbi:MAG: class I SAM-dependent methyltransferase [Spirochaetaceae bacterium]|jgi:SAM-dependent methyltransferase|nr:class I SAM-dependent methyltransferase [Spirochaetaceae bacterium]